MTPAAGSATKRRVLFVSTCPDPWGGSEELWWAAAIALRAAGHDVAVAKTYVRLDHPRVDALVERGCSVREIATPRRRRRADAWNLVAPARLRVNESRLAALKLGADLTPRPDIAVVCQGANFDGIYLARWLQRLGIPMIIVSQKASELDWSYGTHRTAARTVFTAAKRAVFVSRANRELTELQLGTLLPNAVVVDNPVLLRQRLPWPEDESSLRLACVGRLYLLDKGQDLLLQTLARDRWRRRDVELDLVGDGHDREALEDMRDLLGLDRVNVRGFLTDIEGVWRTHHAIVMPSRAEGQPLALMEAMASGRVPIVTPAAGADLVDDGVNGFVIAGPTIDAIDDALDRAWARRNELPQIGAAAAATIADRVSHEPAALARHIEEVLDSIRGPWWPPVVRVALRSVGQRNPARDRRGAPEGGPPASWSRYSEDPVVGAGSACAS